MDLRRRLWGAYLLVGLVAIAVYFVLPSGSFLQANYYSLVGFMGAAAIVAGVRLHRPAAASAWYLIAAAQLLFVVGDSLWSLYEYVLHIAPFPSPADGFYLAGYPLIAAGLLRLLRARRSGPDRAGLIDASIVTIGLGMLAWVFLIDPYVDDHTLTVLETFFSAAYPMGDVLVLAMAVRLTFGAGERTPAFRLLGASLVALLVADVVYAYQILQGTYVTGSPTDLGYLLSYVLFGVTALHPWMGDLSEPQPAVSSKDARRRLWLLALAALLAPVSLVLQASRGVEAEDVPLFALAAAVMFMLVVARLSGVLREVESKDEERKRLLERTLRAAEEERVRIAAELHDGPIQRLSSVGYGFERARLRLERGKVEEGIEVFGRAQEGLSGEVQQLRQIMTALRPPALDERGLGGAVRDRARALSRRGRSEFRVNAELEERLDPDVETVLYRVAQEALTNVTKHSKASNVWIDLGRRNGSVEITIRDDGVGFDVGGVPRLAREGHFGLVAMQEQVKMTGGTCEIASKPGEGTTVRAWYPAEVIR